MRANLIFEAVCRLAGLSLLFGASISCVGAAESVLTNQPLQTITHTGQSQNPANPAAGGAALDKAAITCLTQLQQLPLNRLGNESGLPVRFEGTMLFANPAKGLMALRDDTTAAILDYESVGESFRPGEKIQLEGVARMVGGRPTDRRLWSLDNDGLHGPVEKQVTLPLKAGPHPIRLDWFNAAAGAALEVYLEGPGFPWQKIPDAALFHDEPNPTGGSSNRVAGLNYSCYEGTWIQLPNFQGLKAVKTGVTANFDIGLVTRPDNVGLAFRGWVVVPHDGDYTFTLISDDGSRLAVGDMGRGDGQAGVVKSTGLIGALPVPQRLFPGAVLSSNDPVPWSTIEGVVTFIDRSKTPPQLELTDGSVKMQVETVESLGEFLFLLVQSRIRVTGLMEPRLTPEGRFIAGKLLVPDFKSVALLEAAPRHWNQYPLQTISNLLAHPPRPDSV